MDLQRLMSLSRKAIDDYGMINEGDTVAVGVSGGKDSLTLLTALAGLRRFYPKKFSLQAITVDMGFPEAAEGLLPIRRLCEDLDVPYTVVPSQIAEIVFEDRKEKNPCSLCAKLRKGAFNTAAKELGCNKVAYGHHKNDMVETLMLSLIYESRIYCFSPVLYLDRMDLTVIRPLIYVDESDIRGYAAANRLPVFRNPCPADGFTRREYVKQLVGEITKENPGARDRMHAAILRADLPGWPEKRNCLNNRNISEACGFRE